jgi:hypothetical protein
VLQIAKREGKEDPESLPDEKEVKPIFRNNPGKTGIIFDEKHDYFTGMDRKTKKNVMHQMRNILSKEDVFDRVYQSPTTSNTLDVHITHDGAERKENVELAKKIADLNWSGKLLPVDWTKRNPDYMRSDGELMEFKKLEGRNSIKNGVRNAMRKSKDLHQIIFNATSWDRPKVVSQLYQQFKKRQQLDIVWIIKDDVMYKISRDQLISNLKSLPE